MNRPTRPEVVFQPFDPEAEVDRSERKLPHWFQPGVTLFVTFRTADSMPAQVIEQWRREHEAWLRDRTKNDTAHTDLISAAQQRAYQRVRHRLWQRALDAGHGDCLLRRPEVARIVEEGLLHFDGERYDLDSFVVMPNHVHLLVQFRPPTTLRRQTKSWLRYTARRINELVGRSGPFWQAEPFDHLVRSGEQFVYLRKYIRQNPEKANLRAGEFLYWSRG